MNIKAYIYATALIAMMSGYWSVLPYDFALAETADKNPAEKSQKSAGGPAKQQGAPSKGGKVMGRHQMVGTVEDIDSQKGIVDLKTEVGELKLHFPPSSLTNIKKGDQIQVQLSFNIANKQ